MASMKIRLSSFWFLLLIISLKSCTKKPSYSLKKEAIHFENILGVTKICNGIAIEKTRDHNLKLTNIKNGNYLGLFYKTNGDYYKLRYSTDGEKIYKLNMFQEDISEENIKTRSGRVLDFNCKELLSVDIKYYKDLLVANNSLFGYKALHVDKTTEIEIKTINTMDYRSSETFFMKKNVLFTHENDNDSMIISNYTYELDSLWVSNLGEIKLSPLPSNPAPSIIETENLFYCSMNKFLYALRAEDGQILNKKSFDGVILDLFLINGDLIYALQKGKGQNSFVSINSLKNGELARLSTNETETGLVKVYNFRDYIYLLDRYHLYKISTENWQTEKINLNQIDNQFRFFRDNTTKEDYLLYSNEGNK